MNPVRVGTRSSALAHWQTHYVTGELRALDGAWPVEIVELSTAGDEFPEALLADFEGTGWFTSALERALLAGEIDVAVHSFKDLPVQPHPALTVAAVPLRGPVEDVMCSQRGLALGALAPHARIGTSSARRTAQVRALRPDLSFAPLRGNVPTRIERVRRGDLDAVVLARAGLVRLGLEAHISQVFTIEEMLPAPAQGALAVQVRASDRELAGRIAALDHAPSRLAAETERALLHALGGGCAVPVGAYAVVEPGMIRLAAGVFDLDGKCSARARASGATPAETAVRAASDLVAGGAEEILSLFERSLRPAPQVP